MNPDPNRWITVLRASQERLRRLAQPLASEQLRAPSYDDDWTIAQVLSHLGSQAEIGGRSLDAGLGRGEPLDQGGREAIWDVWNHRSPEEQRDLGLPSIEALLARIGSVSAAEWKAFELPMSGRQLDAVGFLRMRLSEHALHTWDVAVALDPSAVVSADAVELLVDVLPELVGRLGKPTGAAKAAKAAKVDTTDPARSWILSVENETVSLAEWHDQPTDGTLRLPAEALLRLVYGRLDPAHTPETVDATDIDLDELRRVFPGI